MTAPTSSRRAARNTARAESYARTRILIAGVVKTGASPRPRARYSSWIDAGRAPARCPISQINQRACSRSAGAPNTAWCTSASSAALWRTAGLSNRRSVASGAVVIAYVLLATNLGRPYLDHQPVVRGCNPVGEACRELGVRGVVRQVGEKRAARADLLRGRHGLGNGKMERVRAGQQGVQDQDFESREPGPRRVRDRLRVREVGERPDPEPEHGVVAMGQRQRAYRHPGDLRHAVRVERARGELGLARARGSRRVVEDVVKASSQLRQRAGRAILLVR